MFRSKSFHYNAPIPSIITLINSTAGVALLAMPYCFQQCGVFLSVICLIVTAMVCIASCSMVIRLCITHKGSSIEATCFRYLGLRGKMIAEISVIGFMIGSMISYDVSLADLGAGIVSQVSNTLPPQNLRVVMLALFTVAITPLCLISRVQSLTKMSAFAMLFYLAILLHMIFVLGGPKLISGMPTTLVWWCPTGLMRCLPIFFASIFCQTQLLTIYTSLHQPSVAVMHSIVQITVVIISIVYGLFGFLGYVAFAHSGKILGNVFLMYPDDLISFCVQAGFLFTVTVSIPLTLFPLRQSLHSFLSHQPKPHATTADLDVDTEFEMPAKRFRMLTICILVSCFSLSLTTDKIEIIIELTASLTGSLIGYILPALATLSAFSFVRSPRERRVALYLLIVGVSLFLLGLASVPSLSSTSSADLPSPSAVDERLLKPNIVAIPASIDSDNTRRSAESSNALPTMLYQPLENQAQLPHNRIPVVPDPNLPKHKNSDIMKEQLVDSPKIKIQRSELLRPKQVQAIPVEVAEPKVPIDLDESIHIGQDGSLRNGPQKSSEVFKTKGTQAANSLVVPLQQDNGVPALGKQKSVVQEADANKVAKERLQENDTKPFQLAAPKILPVDVVSSEQPTNHSETVHLKPIKKTDGKIQTDTNHIRLKTPVPVDVVITTESALGKHTTSDSTRTKEQPDSGPFPKKELNQSVKIPRVEVPVEHVQKQDESNKRAAPEKSTQMPVKQGTVVKNQPKINVNNSFPELIKDQVNGTVKSTQDKNVLKKHVAGLR